MAFHLRLLAAALLPSIVACGGDDGGPVTPEGDHYTYVVSDVRVPTTNAQANEYGIDVDGNGTIDNRLGEVLGTLASVGMFDVQGTVDEAVAEGDIVLLVDFQTRDFNNTSAAGIQVFLGDSDTVMPAACNQGEMWDETTMMGCRHHLDGTGMFTIDPASPTNAALAGPIVNGTFEGGPGNLSLQISFGGAMALQLDLIGARVKASNLTADSLGGVVFAGAISKSDIDNKLIPAIQAQIEPLIAADCTDLASPPACGCAEGSTGRLILNLFDAKLADGSPGKDCKVSVDEIQTNSVIAVALTPDVTIDGVESLSLGIKGIGTKATFTVPGQ